MRYGGLQASKDSNCVHIMSNNDMHIITIIIHFLSHITVTVICIAERLSFICGHADVAGACGVSFMSLPGSQAILPDAACDTSR